MSTDEIKQLIIELIKNIDDSSAIIKIYTFVKIFS